MDEFGEFGPLDVQLAKEKEDSPEYEKESALNDLHSLKILESRALQLYHETFLSLYNNKKIKINKNELSKQVFEFMTLFYRPLLEQIDPYKLGFKKRKLDIGEKYAEKILFQYNQDAKKDRDRARYLINIYGIMKL